MILKQELLTAEQVARRLGVSRDRVYQLFARGDMVARRTLQLTRSDLLEIERFAARPIAPPWRRLRNAPGHLTTAQVAERLGIGYQRVHDLVSVGRIVPVVQSLRGHEVHRVEVERFARSSVLDFGGSLNRN